MTHPSPLRWRGQHVFKNILKNALYPLLGGERKGWVVVCLAIKGKPAHGR